jgi:tetratricopeptide (TPR) repeat protein
MRYLLLHAVRSLWRSVWEFVKKILVILFRPLAYADHIQIGSSKDLIRAGRFYFECCFYSSIAWIFLIYVFGAKGIHDTLFPGSPELGRALYVLVGFAWTSVTGLGLLVGVRRWHGQKIDVGSFFHCFSYASGAILILMAVLACIGAAYILWADVDINEAQTRLTLLEMIGGPYVCIEPQSIECKLSLLDISQDGWVYPILGGTLLALLSYQTVLTSIFLNQKFGIPVRTLLIGMLVFLIFAVQSVRTAAEWNLAGIISAYLVDRTPAKVMFDYNRGISALRRGQYQDATQYFKAVLDRNSDFADARDGMCLATAAAVLDPERRKERSDLSVEHCDDAIAQAERMNRRSPWKPYLFRGVIHAERNQYAKALEDLARCTNLAPQSALAHWYVGSVQRKLRRYDKAIEAYTKAISNYKPHGGGVYVSAYKERAVAYMRVGKFAEAVADLDTVVGIERDDSEAYNARGLARFRSGDRASAQKDFAEAIKRDSKNAVAYANRGTMRLWDGQYDEALEDYNVAVRIRQDLARIYQLRGLALWKKELIQQARANLRMALQLVELDLAKAEVGDDAGGRDRFEVAEQLGNVAHFALFADAYERALNASLEAGRHAPEELWIKTNQAHALLFLGRTNEARDIYLDNKGQSWGGRTWEAIIGDDFNELEFKALGGEHTSALRQIREELKKP